VGEMTPLPMAAPTQIVDSDGDGVPDKLDGAFQSSYFA